MDVMENRSFKRKMNGGFGSRFLQVWGVKIGVEVEKKKMKHVLNCLVKIEV